MNNLNFEKKMTEHDNLMIKHFQHKLDKYKRYVNIKDKIHEAWLGILNKVNLIDNQNPKTFASPFRNVNITMNMDRLDHKKDLTYYYKRIINFLYQEDANEKRDKNKISLVFNKNLYNNEENDEFKLEKVRTNINDFIVNDKEKYAKSLRRIALGKFIYSVQFQVFLAIVIFLNSITLVIQNDNIYFNIFENFTNSVFLIELLLKWYYGFRVYWYSAWNIFDFILVLLSFIPLFFKNQKNAERAFVGLRIIRALRSLRSISIFYGLQVLVESIFKSAFDMINIVFLMLLIMIMLSLFANNIFGQAASKYFQNLGNGMMSLFYCATCEGLSDLFDAVKEDHLVHFWKLFIVISIVILAFILTNLIVAVVVTRMEQSLKEKDKKEKIKRQLKLIEGHEKLSEHHDIDDMFSEKLHIIKGAEIMKGE